MLKVMARVRCFIIPSVVCMMGCTPAPIKDVVRPNPGEPFLESLPPMTDFGPFASFEDALNEACPLILSKPNASVSHIKDPELALRVSTEYCAWLYYTPDDKYRMSMLTDQSDVGDLLTKRRTCRLPAFVDDRRYPPHSLKYIFALHNHPFGGPLSLADMHQIIAFANTHEWVVETKDGKIPIAIVAFFSRSDDHSKPTCDGFYQYTPETRYLLQFNRAQEGWRRDEIGQVTWINTTTYQLNGKTYRFGSK